MATNACKFFYCALFFLFLSCEFNTSPYITRVPKIRKNEVNITMIKESEASSEDNFKVAFISDTHNYYDELNRLVKAINQNGPYHFVIVGGDVTNYGLLEEYEEALRLLNKLRFPYLVVPGNHDLISNGKKIYDRIFGDTEFTLTYKNAYFVFFNNNNWETGGVVPDKSWVETALFSSTAQFKILVAHVSPIDHARFSNLEISNWETLLTTNGVNYFFNGHDHNPVESDLGSAKRITIGSPSKGSYYELIVSPLGISHQKISF